MLPTSLIWGSRAIASDLTLISVLTDSWACWKSPLPHCSPITLRPKDCSVKCQFLNKRNLWGEDWWVPQGFQEYYTYTLGHVNTRIHSMQVTKLSFLFPSLPLHPRWGSNSGTGGPGRPYFPSSMPFWHPLLWRWLVCLWAIGMCDANSLENLYSLCLFLVRASCLESSYQALTGR